MIIQLGIAVGVSQITAIAAAKGEEDDKKGHTPDLCGTYPK